MLHHMRVHEYKYLRPHMRLPRYISKTLVVLVRTTSYPRPHHKSPTSTLSCIFQTFELFSVCSRITVREAARFELIFRLVVAESSGCSWTCCILVAHCRTSSRTWIEHDAQSRADRESARPVCGSYLASLSGSESVAQADLPLK